MVRGRKTNSSDISKIKLSDNSKTILLICFIKELIFYNLVIHPKFGKAMSDKIMLNFRCPTSVLEAIDSLGKERYPANTKHECDQSKTLMEIVRAGIEALSDGSVVLRTPAKVRQQPDDVRQKLSDSLLEARITEMLTRNTEPLLAELADIKASQADAIERAKAELRTELLGELAG